MTAPQTRGPTHRERDPTLARGLDPFFESHDKQLRSIWDTIQTPPSRDLRLNHAGLDDRIELRMTALEDLEDYGGFDLAWVPSFFIPQGVLDRACDRLHAVLRSGGEVVMGVHEQSEDVLAGAVDALFTVRAGGSVLSPDDAVARLRRAGFTDAQAVAKSGDVPLRLVRATRE